MFYYFRVKNDSRGLMTTKIGESQAAAEGGSISKKAESQPQMVIAVPEKEDTLLFASKTREILLSFHSGFKTGVEMQFDFNEYMKVINDELDKRERLN